MHPWARFVALLLVVVPVGALIFGAYQWGNITGFARGKREAQVEVEKLRPPEILSPELEARIDAAFAQLRTGSPAAALDMFSVLRKEHPGLPTISYLVALSALQAGFEHAAREAALESIEKGERVSDAKALLANISKPGDGERLLKEALAADPANPYPHVDLAGRLRNKGDAAGSLRHLRGARLRLLPIEAASVVEVSELLTQLEMQPDAELPSVPTGATRLLRRWSEAYLHLRRGRFEEAAAIFDELRAEYSPDVYDYVINDPAIKLFASEPVLRPLFK